MTIEKKHVIQAIHIMKQLQAKAPVAINTSSDGCDGCCGECGGQSKK
ncbi:hypothetical protein [Bathymodiolus heckerae thiotrophic gill symbiont]|nr:hypothetical protein [Bathymodiolus heckerae thiotrophic gill symbiont]CAC9536474.1 hypothetical protein [uncultured Gammaproteobacteria bacterium]